MVSNSSNVDKARLELETSNTRLDEVNRRRLNSHSRCITEQYQQISRLKLRLKKSAGSGHYRLIACINLNDCHYQPTLTVETRGNCLAQVIDRIFQRLQQRLNKLKPMPISTKTSLKLTPNYAIAAAIKWCDH
ncbi:hypothetical protein DC094_14385 [Pelagibaculum spongiae]|uniref:Uncharacterized protein n=1 Tax=Pelagibaculum spongiae TaxID=2080658 RepID=A0A2V1GSC5_9GAMM|nr:hypothetical protein DC094_14385 [Pelagibaculum spongiae]